MQTHGRSIFMAALAGLMSCALMLTSGIASAETPHGLILFHKMPEPGSWVKYEMEMGTGDEGETVKADFFVAYVDRQRVDGKPGCWIEIYGEITESSMDDGDEKIRLRVLVPKKYLSPKHCPADHVIEAYAAENDQDASPAVSHEADQFLAGPFKNAKSVETKTVDTPWGEWECEVVEKAYKDGATHTVTLCDEAPFGVYQYLLSDDFLNITMTLVDTGDEAESFFTKKELRKAKAKAEDREAQADMAPAAEVVDEPADEQTVEEMLAERQQSFEERIKSDPAWKASHEETAVLAPIGEGKTDGVHSFCLDAKERLLVCCGGARITYERDPDNPMLPVVKEIADPAEVRVLSTDGELLDTWTFDFAPQAITLADDGTIYVGGEGRIVHLDADGDVLAETKSPNAPDEAAAEEAPKDRYAEYAVSIKQNALDNGMSEEEAQKQADQIVKQLRESQERYRKMQIEQLVKNGMTEEEAEKRLDDVEAMQAKYSRKMKTKVNGLAISGDDVFVTCSAPNGTGFGVWRMDKSLEGDAVQIVEKLRGCCGQMDIQAHDGMLYVAENAGHHVLRYDRDGEKIDEFGKNNPNAPEGFGGCCEPKNLRFGEDDTLYACESGPPVIVRSYAPDGEFKGVVGFPSFTTGCVRVTVDVTKDKSKVFVLNANESKIHVLTPVEE